MRGFLLAFFGLLWDGKVRLKVYRPMLKPCILRGLEPWAQIFWKCDLYDAVQFAGYADVRTRVCPSE